MNGVMSCRPGEALDGEVPALRHDDHRLEDDDDTKQSEEDDEDRVHFHGLAAPYECARNRLGLINSFSHSDMGPAIRHVKLRRRHLKFQSY